MARVSNGNPSKPRILVIEDDPPIRRFLNTTLTTQDYELIEATTGKEGLSLAASHVPDVILLDLGLPDIDGLEIIRKIREWSATPIIIISARGQERDKVAGLDAGADDYLTKPFGVGELLARIRASLRRRSQVSADEPESEAMIGNVRVDLGLRQIWRDGNEIHLTPTEFSLLAALLHERGKVLTHRQLLQEVWGPSHVGQSHYLRIYILQLRRKLEDDSTRPRWIVSEPGVGYRLRSE